MPLMLGVPHALKLVSFAVLSFTNLTMIMMRMKNNIKTKCWLYVGCAITAITLTHSLGNVNQKLLGTDQLSFSATQSQSLVDLHYGKLTISATSSPATSPPPHRRTKCED